MFTELTNEVATLKEKLAECDTQKHADKDCLKTMQLIVDSLTQNKLEAANRIADMEKSIKNLNQQLSTCNERLAKFSELEIENEAKTKQIQRLTNENEEQEMDLRNLDEKLAKVSELSQRQTQELLVLEQSVDKWRTMEAAYQKLQNDNRELQAKLDAIANPVDDVIASNQHEELIKNLQAERDNNRRIYEEATEQVNLLKSELDKLRQSQDDDDDDEKIDVLKEQLHHENEQLKKKCDEQAYKLEKYKGKVCEFSSKLKEVKQSKMLLSDTLLEYSKSVTKWHVQFSHASKLLVKEVNGLNEAKGELENQINCHESIIKDLRKTIDELELRVEDAAKNNDTDEIKEKYEMLLTEYKTLQADIETKNSEIANVTQEWEQICTSLKEENSKRGSEIEKLTKECQNKSKQLCKIEEKMAADNKQNEEFSNETNRLNDMVKELEETINELESRLADASLTNENNSSFEDKYEKLVAEHKSLEIEIGNKNNKISKLSEELEQINASLKEQREKYAAEVKEQNDDFQAKVRTIAEFEEKNKELLAKIDLLNEEQQGMKITINELEFRLADTSKDDEINDNKVKYEELQENYNSLHLEIVNKNDELKKLAQELETVQVELNDRNKQYSTEIKKLSDECQAKCQQLLELEEKEKVATKEHEELLAEMRELNDVLKKRGEIISNQTAEIDQLKIKFNDQSKQITSLEDNIKDKTKQLEQLRNQFDNQSEILSTSTISRADEISRMRDIEDSFEEKYNKLRALALKLKKKNAEQQATIAKLESVKTTDTELSNAPLQASAPVQTQNVISLQKDNDRLLDQIDTMKSEQKQLKTEIKQLNELIKKGEEETKSLRIMNDDIKATADANLKIKSALNEQIESLKNDNKSITQQLKNAENETIKVKGM